jgi:citrate synthase
VGNVDQRGFSNQHGGAPEWLDAAAAIRLLGVKRETLYAYASRGLVRSVVAPPGARGRLYLRDDLERLRARRDARAGHGPVAAAALKWGEPVLSSAITRLDAAGPAYRGVPATRLAAEGAPFERVAELLWTGVTPAQRPLWPRLARAMLGRVAAQVPRGTPPLQTMLLVAPALGVRDPARVHLAEEAERERARGLIGALAATMGAGVGLGPKVAEAPTIAECALRALGVARPSARALALVEKALVLSADHELNASTFAARVTASAGADLYACVTTALAVMTGPLHGGAADRVAALVEEVGRPARARAVVTARAARGEALPGFGHTLYRDGDPRARPLLDGAQAIGGRRRELAALFALGDAVRALRGEEPTVDLGLVAVAIALGLPPGAPSALFALGRLAGCVAHVIEQRAQGFLLRPRAHYVGP